MTRDLGPVRHFADGLIWHHGEPRPAAVFELSGAGCMFAGKSRRAVHRDLLEAAVRNLPDGAILSVASPLTPERVVEMQRAGDRDDAYRAWCELAAAGEWFERSFWLCVRLSDREKVADMARRFIAEQWSSRRGVVPAPPTRGEIAVAVSSANRVPARLGLLDVRAATCAEVKWLAARRFEPNLPRPAITPVTLGGPFRRSSPVWADTVLEADPARRVIWIRRPRGAATAIATVVVTGSPPEEFDPDPGVSFDAGAVNRAERADGGTWPSDTMVRWWIDPKDETTLQWRARNLAHEVKQGDAFDAAGADRGKVRASTEIGDLRDRLAHREGPQIRTLTTMTVWADGDPAGALDEVDDHLDAIQAAVGGGWELTRPPADQLVLLDAQLPGAKVPSGTVAWSDPVLPAMVGALAPAAGERSGDRRGYLLGRLTGDVCGEPFLWDPTRGPQEDVNAPANLLVLGESGSGKSSFSKTVALALSARDGWVIAVDPSPSGEWGDVAEAAARNGWSAQVVRPERGGMSLDPLRTLSGDLAVDGAVRTLNSMGGVTAGSGEAAAIREAVERAALRGGSLRDAVDDLETAPDDESRSVGRRISALTRHHHARCLFDPDLPPVTGDARFVVIALNDLALGDGKTAPTEDELVGQAVVTAALGFARSWAFMQSEFALMVIEEFGVLQGAPWAISLVDRTQKLARKYKAGVATIAQYPSEVPPSIAAGCRQVAMFRCPDIGLELQAAAVLLRRADDDAAMGAVPQLVNGRFLFLDLDANLAMVQGSRPPVRELRDAVDTSTPVSA